MRTTKAFFAKLKIASVATTAYVLTVRQKDASVHALLDGLVLTVTVRKNQIHLAKQPQVSILTSLGRKKFDLENGNDILRKALPCTSPQSRVRLDTIAIVAHSHEKSLQLAFKPFMAFF